MKNQFVRDWMSKNPATISSKATLPEAHNLMRERKVRRLPVIDHDKVVGIISLTDVLEAKPSDATTLSIYELNYLLAKLTVAKIMTKQVMTVSPDTSIGDAARMMLDYKIGGIPVVDGDKLVGIITESDIFRMVVQTYTD
ncbi:MAG: CBS domain-containing protein [Anaerolineae bacterium]|nr:CBS domain-containing protein [Anaerolineae bacterium]